MAYDRYLIAPYQNGLRKDLTTWLTPQDSFKRFDNVNILRGKIKKRFGEKLVGGTKLTSRTRYALTGGAGVGITDGAGAATGTVPGAIFEVGQVFSIGDEIFTVKETGTPADMLTTGAATTATFDTTSGAYVFAGAAATTQIYWYPAQPIMGITHYELGPVNEHTTYVMDTQFIYKFDGTYWSKDTTFTGPFHGDNKQFFWFANYVGAAAGDIALFTTNFNATIGAPGAGDDTMYFYNGTTWADFSAYTKFNSASDIVQTAKIIIAWKNRLLLLNVIEKDLTGPTNAAYVNRVRYSHNGSPLSNNAWLQRREAIGADKGDGGGYIDLPLEQEIVSAAVIKDRLIVYCERSTWELAYTGNAGLPFIWRSLDTNVGSECSHSTVNFENEAVTVGTSGIYACNGSDVMRIDNQIPEEVFSFLKTSDGTSRVHGVRDYYNGLAYWTILEFEAQNTHTFPNKLLVFNYNDHSWSFYDDTITTFGYFEQSTDQTWADPGTWDTADSWGSYYQQGNSRFILAGNHQGFLFVINNDYPQNAPVMTIANFAIAGDAKSAVLRIPDHNLSDGEFIKLEDDNVTFESDGIFKIERADADSFEIVDQAFAGTYEGDGSIQRVSKITIQSNDWNPYIKTGEDVFLARMDFCVKNTQDCNMTVTYDVDTLGWDFVDQGITSGSNLGTNVLELHAYDGLTIETFKDTLWRTIYFQASGNFVNITISMTDEQMLEPDNSLSPFELQGMILYTEKKGN